MKAEKALKEILKYWRKIKYSLQTTCIVMSGNPSAIIEKIGIQLKLEIKNSSTVSGGDINQAFKVNTTDGYYFLKLNDTDSFPLMFEKEAESLHALEQATLFKVPSLLAYGDLHGHQYLVLEWLEKSGPSKNFWQQFAAALAQLHLCTNEYFGFSSNNYIGSLPQHNEAYNTWADFYFHQRIHRLTIQLFNRGDFNKQDVSFAESLHSKLKNIFPEEAPSLLHGDLWARNFMSTNDVNGKNIPALFDPAVYYGHREMDIGMSLLFGGFDSSMYEYYNEYFPLEKNWKKRVTLTQLYPLLVHALLFRGSYIERCKAIIADWQ